MLPEALQSRLALLDGQRPVAPRTLAARAPGLLQSVLDAPAADPADLSLAALVFGSVESTDAGPCFLVSRPLDALCPAAASEALASQVDASPIEASPPERSSPVGPAAAILELSTLRASLARDVVFLDLETCGFSGSPIFLAGLLHDAGRGLVLEQWLARDYREERAVLTAVERVVSQKQVLATFNGKSFDAPMLADRRAYHRMPAGSSRLHVDLLHHARRRWRRSLPNCKLQTLERFLLRRVRQDDLPGSQAPAEYHHFVRTGDARKMGAILHHNALDLVTLLQLGLKLA